MNVEDAFDNLDHQIIRANIALQFSILKERNRMIKLYNDTNLSILNTNLSEIPWQNILLSEDNIDDMTETFYSILHSEIDAVIPSRKVKIYK